MTAAELEKLLAEVTPGEWRKGKCFLSVVADAPTGHDDDRSVKAYGGHLVAESIKLDANQTLILMAPALARRVIAAERMAEALRHLSGIYDCSDVTAAALAAYEAAK